VGDTDPLGIIQEFIRVTVFMVEIKPPEIIQVFTSYFVVCGDSTDPAGIIEYKVRLTVLP
jgi:hypothetical protein